jgi:hypothetical protein
MGVTTPSVAGYCVTWRVPHCLFRHREDFCSFYLIMKYQLILMMYRLEYALNTSVIAIA